MRGLRDDVSGPPVVFAARQDRRGPVRQSSLESMEPGSRSWLMKIKGYVLVGDRQRCSLLREKLPDKVVVVAALRGDL